MSRSLVSRSLAAAAIASLFAFPAVADRTTRDTLDEKGAPFGSTWSETGRFSAVTSAGMDDVRVVAGERWRIRATGDPRALGQLRFLVEREALIVGRISGRRERYGKVRIDITAPALREITAAGSGTVEVDRLAGDRVNATIAGSGSSRIGNVAARRLIVTVAGSGQLALAGRSDTTNLTIAGSGGVDGGGLAAGRTSVTVAGSGTARFRSTGPVSASLVGSGDVFVTGTTRCNQTRMGSGRLVCTG